MRQIASKGIQITTYQTLNQFGKLEFWERALNIELWVHLLLACGYADWSAQVSFLDQSAYSGTYQLSNHIMILNVSFFINHMFSSMSRIATFVL